MIMDKWYRCPYCGQKLFIREKNAAVSGIQIKCKGRGCGKIVRVKIESTVK